MHVYNHLKPPLGIEKEEGKSNQGPPSHHLLSHHHRHQKKRCRHIQGALPENSNPPSLPSHSLNHEPLSHLLAIRRNIRLNQHPRELFEFFRTPYFLCQERQRYNVEELVIELMRLGQVFLLHLVAYLTVFAV